MILTATVLVDEFTDHVSKAFDYEFDGVSTFTLPELPDTPEDFGIGLIVGPSGSGKSSLLKRFGDPARPEWSPQNAVVSHFKSPEDAIERLSAVGFNSIPAWLRPYHVLSAGEKFRADLARLLCDGAVIDEFTSVVDRDVAKACAYAIRRYVDKNRVRNVVFATCHYDVAEWLQPDWTFDTATGLLVRGRSERRPEITLELLPASADAWPIFRAHHYLDGNINRSARCWIAVWNGKPVGFASALAFPNRNFKNAWRGHRTVILPDFQGLGLGVRISDAVAEMFTQNGCRYFSKTAHPRLGEYRQASPKWKPTSKNLKSRADYRADRKTKEDGHKMRHTGRVCYSHEYIGIPSVALC